HLGIEWVYEPDSYRVGTGDRRRGYLPDFHLPADSMWVEVKGTESALDFQLMVDAANPRHGLPLNLEEVGAVVHWRTLQPRIMFAGEVPAGPAFHHALGVINRRDVVRHMMMAVCDGSVFDDEDQAAKKHPHSFVPFHHVDVVPTDDAGVLTGEAPTGLLKPYGYGMACPWIAEAYTAARSARFEHGEEG
ncbi:MAG TPA: hypothetical protein VGD43_02980, partial [Micromonospora sp.]